MRNPESGIRNPKGLARISHSHLLRHRMSRPGLRQRHRSDPGPRSGGAGARIRSDRRLFLARTRPTAPRDGVCEKCGLARSRNVAWDNFLVSSSELIVRELSPRPHDRGDPDHGNERSGQQKNPAASRTRGSFVVYAFQLLHSSNLASRASPKTVVHKTGPHGANRIRSRRR